MRRALWVAVAVAAMGCNVNGKILAFLDEDGDGYYPPSAEAAGAAAPWDCDESDPNVNPAAEDVCDGLDNDCDGEIDGGTPQLLYYPDVDGDLHGNAEFGVLQCDPDAGWVALGDDCDDGLSSRYPSADELCDQKDNDCDGDVDEDTIDGDTWYVDMDGDGYGNADRSESLCNDIPDGLVDTGGDCDDTDATTYPTAPETDCTDPHDYNCDGNVDYLDADGDGTAACDDCDDADGTVSPDFDEICGNGIDDNCNDDADGCVLADTYDILSPDAWAQRFVSANKYEQFGASVAGGYDFNGDGQLDLAIGAPQYSNVSPWTSYGGRVAILYGMPDEGSSAGAPDASVTGLTTSAYLGIAIAGLPDGNADGKDDLLIGAPSTYTGPGTAYLFAAGMTSGLTTGNATATITCGGISSDYSQCGSALAFAGDVNDDSIPDFLVGAHGLDAAALSDSGRAALFLGPQSGTRTFSNAVATFTGVVASARVGKALGAAGDVNGDGVDDILIGCPNQTFSTTQDGAAWLFYGPISGDNAVSVASADAWVYGSSSYQYLGTSVAGVGDLNEDGYDDFATGATSVDSSRGAVYIFQGAMGLAGNRSVGSAVSTISGSETGNEVGSGIISAGDVNADGLLDVAVSATSYDTRLNGTVGAVYLGYGPFAGTRSLTTVGSTTGAVWVGATYYGRLGIGMSSAGDINDDGYGDLTLGESGYSASAYYSQEGAAYLILGGGL